jgi:hypothetical protein
MSNKFEDFWERLELPLPEPKTVTMMDKAKDMHVAYMCLAGACVENTIHVAEMSMASFCRLKK